MEFESLFTHRSDEVVTAADLINLLRFLEQMNEKQLLTAAWLRQFIQSCDSEGEFCRFHFWWFKLLHPMPMQFVKGDAVIGATCQLKLTLPVDFNSYSDFRQGLLAGLSHGRKSFTMI